MTTELDKKIEAKEVAVVAAKEVVIAQKQLITKDNIKQVIISIIIGACVAFFSTLFQSLADLLKTHSTEIIAGMATTGTYLAKAYRA